MQTTETISEALVEWRPALAGCQVSGVGIEFTRAMEFEEWKNYGRTLCKAAQSLPWWIGDWLAFGRKLFCNRDEATGKFTSGDGTSRYEAAMEITKLDGSTLATYAYVSQNLPILLRREPGVLSWTHHREVAPLKPKDQAYWLDRAVAKGWSVSELRQAIRKEQATESLEAGDRDDKAPINLIKIATDFDRCLKRLEGEVESWPPARRRLVKQDLGNHIKEAQEFYDKL